MACPTGYRDRWKRCRRDGLAVVANVSRSVVEVARRGLEPVGVVVVSAPPSVLAVRLARRGRESAEDIRGRLSAPPCPCRRAKGFAKGEQ